MQLISDIIQGWNTETPSTEARPSAASAGIQGTSSHVTHFVSVKSL